MKLNRAKKGFTIVELVIVIGVIGILSAILIPTFVNVTKNAERSALKSNLANAYSAYIAEASDEKYDGYYSSNQGEELAIVCKAMDEVTLEYKGNYYTFDGEWKENNAAAHAVLPVAAGTYYVLNGENYEEAPATVTQLSLSTFNKEVVVYVG